MPSSASTSPANTRTLAHLSGVGDNYDTVVQQLYVAYFGRPADLTGLANFKSLLAAAGGPSDIQGMNAAYNSNSAVKALIDSFGTSAESNALYGGDTTGFVTAIYTNVLNRPPDSGGLNFWVKAINDGTLTKANASFSIMAGALANTTSQGMIDAALVNNKIKVASDFTHEIPGLQVYNGEAAAAIARNMLATVTNTTDTNAFRSTIQTTIDQLVGRTPPPPIMRSPAPTLPEPPPPPPAASYSQTVRLDAPKSVAIGTDGALFVVDATGIRRLTESGESRRISQEIGNRIAVDPRNNDLYITRTGSILRITAAGAASSFGQGVVSNPFGIAINSFGFVYVADPTASTLRKFAPGGATNESISMPSGFEPNLLAFDTAGNSLLLADVLQSYTRSPDYSLLGAGVIYRVSTSAPSTFTRIAGNYGWAYSRPTGLPAAFFRPRGLVVDSKNIIYLASQRDGLVRIDPGVAPPADSAGLQPVGTVAQVVSPSQFSSPQGLAVDSAGNIYVADEGNHTVKKVSPSGQILATIGVAGERGSAD